MTADKLPEKITFAHSKYIDGKTVYFNQGYDIDSIDRRETAIAEELKIVLQDVKKQKTDQEKLVIFELNIKTLIKKLMEDA